jgi:4-hydroxybenzoate polyprenyltransferase
MPAQPDEVTMTESSSKFSAYLALIRFHRPIGTWLLLWPTLGALWLASEGVPPWSLLFIFCAGTFLMRSAGCAVNDLADRNLDAAVERTRERPLVVGTLTVMEALIFSAALALVAFVLVLFTNTLTISLSFAAVALAALYPFMKRHTHLPQLVLGAAFSWGIPMAFAATRNSLPAELWLVFIANLLWTVAYDTEYAMVDRKDDLKAGIKSTAILFGDLDKIIIGVLQLFTLLALLLVAQRFDLGWFYHLGLLVAAGVFVRQQWLIREREPLACFQAFILNNYVGMAVFIGIVVHYWFDGSV